MIYASRLAYTTQETVVACDLTESRQQIQNLADVGRQT